MFSMFKDLKEIKNERKGLRDGSAVKCPYL